MLDKLAHTRSFDTGLSSGHQDMAWALTHLHAVVAQHEALQLAALLQGTAHTGAAHVPDVRRIRYQTEQAARAGLRIASAPTSVFMHMGAPRSRVKVTQTTRMASRTDQSCKSDQRWRALTWIPAASCSAPSSPRALFPMLRCCRAVIFSWDRSRDVTRLVSLQKTHDTHCCS